MCLFKQYITLTNLFKILCTALTLFLMYQELRNYAVTKPTVTSSELTDLDSIPFSDISVCLNPALDANALINHGYKIDTYYRGSMDGILMLA
jgi:hypothetical protein